MFRSYQLRCVSWQYRADKGCMFMGDVRVGVAEHGKRTTQAYCDDAPPALWRGRQLARRSGGHCEWEDWALQGQCWGLGARKAGAASRSEQACADACCADPLCGTWQWREDKGCFYSKPRKPRHFCDDHSSQA